MSERKFWLQTGVTDPVKGVCHYHVVLAVDYEAIRAELDKVTQERDDYHKKAIELAERRDSLEDIHREDHAIADALLSKVCAERDAALAQLAAARADTERLDWLEANPSDVFTHEAGGYSVGYEHDYSATLRAAIDSAKEGM